MKLAGKLALAAAAGLIAGCSSLGDRMQNAAANATVEHPVAITIGEDGQITVEDVVRINYTHNSIRWKINKGDDSRFVFRKGGIDFKPMPTSVPTSGACKDVTFADPRTFFGEPAGQGGGKSDYKKSKVTQPTQPVCFEYSIRIRDKQNNVDIDKDPWVRID